MQQIKKNHTQSNSWLHLFRCFVSIFQTLFQWVSFGSMPLIFHAFFKPLFRSVLQTKIHLETAQKPPNNHIEVQSAINTGCKPFSWCQKTGPKEAWTFMVQACKRPKLIYCVHWFLTFLIIAVPYSRYISAPWRKCLRILFTMELRPYVCFHQIIIMYCLYSFIHLQYAINVKKRHFNHKLQII